MRGGVRSILDGAGVVPRHRRRSGRGIAVELDGLTITERIVAVNGAGIFTWARRPSRFATPRIDGATSANNVAPVSSTGAGTLLLENVTVSGNTVPTSEAVAASTSGRAQQLVHVTVASNSGGTAAADSGRAERERHTRRTRWSPTM